MWADFAEVGQQISAKSAYSFGLRAKPATRKRRLSADLNHETGVFPTRSAALTMLNLIRYTWRALTYDKSANFRSESIVLPMRQSAHFCPDQGSLT